MKTTTTTLATVLGKDITLVEGGRSRGRNLVMWGNTMLGRALGWYWTPIDLELVPSEVQAVVADLRARGAFLGKGR